MPWKPSGPLPGSPTAPHLVALGAQMLTIVAGQAGSGFAPQMSAQRCQRWCRSNTLGLGRRLHHKRSAQGAQLLHSRAAGQMARGHRLKPVAGGQVRVWRARLAVPGGQRAPPAAPRRRRPDLPHSDEHGRVWRGIRTPEGRRPYDCPFFRYLGYPNGPRFLSSACGRDFTQSPKADVVGAGHACP